MSGSLAKQQEALVRALVARGPVPAGVDPDRARVAVHALLRKRLAEVTRHWPVLMADAATGDRFLAWADGRPPAGGHADGLAFARDERRAGRLSPAARAELRAQRRPFRRS